ncbi:uncharacterized protein LOC110732545 [Chenopodium quinoa]|uniref:uncharacterized protein LOC110732545 n=1 Tax=Chenopodium quinoa TaxID=63459 RepID=UPI000B777C85|nr:uncharacterized protein LOC110732545 [Chenopodium quinoa]
MQNGGSSSNGGREARQPLSEVVADCVMRWFQDTLKEAKGGDTNMQVLPEMSKSCFLIALVCAMMLLICLRSCLTIYGFQAKVWMSKASRVRSSVWRVGEKHPGYNASDSDSDELMGRGQ